MPAVGLAVTENLEVVRDVVRQADQLPIRELEGRDSASLQEALTVPLRGLLDRGLGACTELFEAYFDRAELTPSGDPRLIARDLDALVARGDSAAHVADIAFMCCWELRGKREILGAEPSDTFDLISRCASARRRSIKALCAVEISICEHEGADSKLARRYRSELTEALAVRRAFAGFRSAVAAAAVSRDTAKGRVRGIGIAVAQLIGSDGYLHTRSGDRQHIRVLQQRVLAWLRKGEADEDLASSIIADADRLIEQLRDINRRVELREHDRELAARTLEILFDGGASAVAMPAAVLEELSALRGRDDDIDALLGQGPQPAAPWRDLLVRIAGDQACEPDSRSWSTSREIYLRGRAR